MKNNYQKKSSKKQGKNKKKEKKIIQEPITVTKSGVGYVDPAGEESIEIQPEELAGAFNKDTVKVSLKKHQPRGSKKRQGKVEEVVERAKTTFVGEIKKEGNRYFMIPDDPRIHVKFHLPTAEAKELKESAKIAVEMEEWRDSRKNPKGKIAEVLGKAGEHETEIKSVIYKHGFEVDFPSDVEDEAKEIEKQKKITKEDKDSRKDFRDIPTFTIDPESAKDFDDALSVRELEDGKTEVGVHIADVSHYVDKGSAIDQEAFERGTSIYLVDRAIPMLPLVLSEQVCSLNPNEERLAFSAVFTLDSKGNTKSRWFGRTIINSDKRFTYEEAQEVLDSNKGEFLNELKTLNKLAKTLRRKRVRKGSIEFEGEEVGFELNEDGFPRKVYIKTPLETNKLIEEFMLLANRKIAEYMHDFCKKNSDAAFIYRVHDDPDSEKIEELASYVRAMGYEFETNEGEVTPKELNQLFKKAEGNPEETLIKTTAIKAMSKAAYSIHNIGHFGLSFSKYTHFTSPIRRYPDLEVHRLIKKRLDNEKFTAREEKQLDHIAKHSSERELSAINAERDSIEYKQVEYMSERVGKEFDAVVSGVTEFGLFITEEQTKASGLIKMHNLENDYFKLDQKNYKLVGTKKGKEYILGDKVKVKLINADLKLRELEFTLVETS